MSRQRPLVIAHRGASHDYAEHTLSAYKKAVDDGADALECDVRLTADNVLVCIHDRRVNRTSDGRGPVSTKTLEQLESYDFGSWKHHDWDDMDAEAPRYKDIAKHVLTLDDFLDVAANADRPIGLSIETKHPTRYGRQVEERLAEKLHERGLDNVPPDQTDSVRVMSFAEVAMRRMRRLTPNMPLVLLMQWVPARMRKGWLPQGVEYAGPSVRIIQKHPDFVKHLHESGHKVHVWVADEPDEVQLCLDLGVDGIITNRPDLAREMVDSA